MSTYFFSENKSRESGQANSSNFFTSSNTNFFSIGSTSLITDASPSSYSFIINFSIVALSLWKGINLSSKSFVSL